MMFFARCNWCDSPVPLNDDDIPVSGQWREYDYFTSAYCCPECGLREYSYLVKCNPALLKLPIPPEYSYMLINH